MISQSICVSHFSSAIRAPEKKATRNDPGLETLSLGAPDGDSRVVGAWAYPHGVRKKYHEDMEGSQDEDTPKSSKSLDHIIPYTETHPLVGPLAIFGFTRVPGF